MVLNKQGLERAFSPIKHRRHSGQHRSLNKVTRPGSSTSQTCSNMKVVVRIRPQNVKEFENNYRSIINVVDDNLLIFDPKEEAEPFFFHGAKQTCRDIQKKQNKELEFTFDKVFGCTSTNEDVFKGSTEAIVKSLLDGYNCSVFAYGATGAGKTYTMLGNERYPGITYLTIVELYKEMENISSEKEFELGVSHLEVYNENVRDLIKPSGTLHIQEASYGIRIPGLSVHRIASADELFTLMALGNKNRTQHPTDANAESSRSHSVFQLYIKMTTKLNKNVKIMKLSMIDLAGSERGSATGCKGMRFTEGANINKSLLALGNCINNLADGLKHIPYRDSKLTRLLKDSLGGNCRTVMIANASPSSSCYEDTYNTLKYATRAKNIKQTIKKNVVFVNLPAAQYAKIVESLTAENEALKVKLRMYETGNIPSPAVSVAPVTCTADAVELKEKLSTLYEEKSDINKEILKLGKEIKVLKWRNHTKQTIVDRLPHLSINCTVLNKRIDRIQKSMKQLEGRTASYQQNLKEAFVKWNDNGEKINSLMTKLGSGSYTDLKQHVTNSQLQLEVQEKQMQLEHCHQLLQMQHNDMESQETIIRELCTTFKQYHILLQGHDKMTNAMSSHYEDLVHKLEGIKNISWKNDSETLDCCNLKYTIQNIADLSVQNLHVEGIAGVESSESLSTENKITFKVVNCHDQGNIAESSTCPDMELKRVESCALNQINSLENSEASNVSTVMAAKTNENCEAAVSLPVILKEDILVPPVHRETLEDITDQSSSLNGTFVLSKALISNFQESSAQLPVQKNDIQTKTYFRVNKSRAVKKRNDFRFVGSQCNKENGTPVDRRPTASHLGDRYYGNKNKNFAVPNEPQLRTSNFSVNRAPLQPQKYSPFVMKQEMGRMKKSHINKSHPYSQNYNYY